MTAASPPTGVSDGELVRRRFAVLDTHDAETGDQVFVHWHLSAIHTGAPLEGIEAAGPATKAAFNAKTRLPARVRKRRRR